MNFRDAFDSKGVLPSRSDLPFLPAGTTVELLSKSQDRQQGSALNDAYFTLNPIVPNVQAISLGFFAFYNMFPNIASSPNNSNILGITGPEGVPPTIEFVEGRWASGFGTVTNTQVRGDSGNSNLNDVRWYLIRQALGATTEDDAILSDTLDPVTGILTIDWSPTYVGVDDIAVNPAAGTLYSQLGFTATTTTAGSPEGTQWVGSMALNLGDPVSIALRSNIGELSTADIYQTGPRSRTNDFAVVPINAVPNSINYFEPVNPVTFNTLRNSRPLTSIQIQIVDPVTGQLMPMSSIQQWQCKVILNLG